MPSHYTVQQGDCISSIAYEHGLLPDMIWFYAENAELKRKRKDPNVLMAGDVVVIPDMEIKEVSKPTEQRHQFVLKGVPAVLRLQLLDGNHHPRANMAYKIVVEGVASTGSTDDQGMVIHGIPPDAQWGVLEVKAGKKTERYELRLGQVDPHDELQGVQQRLRNLGYPVGAPSGRMDEPTRTALRIFQAQHQLQSTGEPDTATLNKLREVHRC
jgi:hypothetical protein